MTLLHQTLHPDNLRRAWDDVADNDGCPGVDNITISQWQRNWEERLVTLARAVRTNRYKPGGLRIRRVPKRHAPDKRILRIQGYTLVLNADIDDFFNQIDHTLLAPISP